MSQAAPWATRIRCQSNWQLPHQVEPSEPQIRAHRIRSPETSAPARQLSVDPNRFGSAQPSDPLSYHKRTPFPPPAGPPLAVRPAPGTDPNPPCRPPKRAHACRVDRAHMGAAAHTCTCDGTTMKARGHVRSPLVSTMPDFPARSRHGGDGRGRADVQVCVLRASR